MLVTLVLDLYDGQGRQLRSGQAVMRPSWALDDIPDMQVIPPAAAVGTFLPRSTPSVTVLASDSTGPQPSGWTWDISFAVPGKLAPRSVYAPAGPVAFTATDAVPAVFTWAPGDYPWQVQSLPAGTGVQLSGHRVPLGFSAGAVYYVVASSGFTVQLAAYQGGPALGSLSAGSGELTVAQYQLSALACVRPAAQMSGYLPSPAGTAAAGDTIVATGPGAFEWGQLTAGDVGALPLAGGTVQGELSPTVTTLASSGSVPVDATAGNVFTLTMTANTTLVNPAGGSDGQVIRVRVTSNGYSLAYGDAYLFGDAGQPTLSGSSTDLLAFEYVADLDGWVLMGSALGFTS